MADIKISQLIPASVVNSSDVLPVVVGSSSPCTLTTRQATVAQIVSGGFVNSAISQSIALGISAPSASIASLNAWTSSLSESVQSINVATSSFLLTSSFNAWTGSGASMFYGTSSRAISSSNALTASYINVVGKEIIANWVGNQLQLTSSQIEIQTLQSTTTFGNQTSQSIQLVGSASITAAGGITGSLLGTAATASYVDVVGQYITVNRLGSQIQLTGSDNSAFVTTSSFGAYTASVNLWTSSLSESVQAINLWSSSVLLSQLTSSFVFTSSYNVDSASWNQKDIDLFSSQSITSASNAVINLWTSSVLLSELTSSFVFTSSYNIDSASWNQKDVDLFASESITSASNAVINLWTSSLSESVQAINAWTSSVLLDAEFIGWTLSNSASFAGTASYVTNAQSASYVALKG